jgi:AcrR family transcriptional regulator
MWPKMTLKKYERDKETKIQRIIQSTKILVEDNGYSTVSIRDIAKKANVSIGLIYKYFPKGKFEILKQLSLEHMNENFMINQPEKIDFADFPGYMRKVNENMLELHNKNAKLIKAFTIAALMEDNVLEDIKMANTEDYVIISEFFSNFKGVELSDKDPVNMLTEWSLTVKSLIFYNTMFPTIFKDEESLLNMLVDISLKIWDYKP